ncbi:MAG: polyribonucleotide nucleotidyltransferase [bacterium]|jgi:polyribonucleotide nucleotidyltransferase
MVVEEKIEIGGNTLSIESGRVAKQAGGAVLVRYGDTVVLVTTVISKEPLEGYTFLPLLVEYREKSYAAGKIPGGFFKREGRPSEKEILSARLIDRPVRSRFPRGFRHDVQVAATVLSSDQENDSDILAVVGASASLALAGAPVGEPLAAVRVGRVDGEWIVNPTFQQKAEGDVDMVVVGAGDEIVMVEGGMKEVSEEDFLKCIEVAAAELPKVTDMIKKIAEKCGKEEIAFTPPEINPEVLSEIESRYGSRIREACEFPEKTERHDKIKVVKEEARVAFEEKLEEWESDIDEALSKIEHDHLRALIINEDRRVDGRSLADVRPITCEIGVLPRTHGSALFTRGQTQSLTVTTLGTAMDEQRIDDLEGESTKSYMLHYNFPPFSVGEIRPFRGPARREIGHGALAERSIQPVIPESEVFPYTVRLVSDILESNGSSSMATVCAGTLALMDAGVPIKAPVSGVAMGIVVEEDRYKILTDILGVEDHHGDMDFKVAGTRNGLTAVQMDLKIPGLTIDIIREILAQSTPARMHILDKMEATIPAPRAELSTYAPRIIAMQIDREKIRDVIGPGGKIIRGIIEETGAVIDIEDDGSVRIFSADGEAGLKAKAIVESLVQEPEVGKVYNGVVKRIVDFGAFVEILPGKDGLLHVSEIDLHRVENVHDVLKEGDEIQVKLIGFEREGKMRLSRKVLLDGYDPEADSRRSDRGGSGGRRPGGRSSDRRGSGGRSSGGRRDERRRDDHRRDDRRRHSGSRSDGNR